MIIRPLDNSDLQDLRKIHKKFYKEEFAFPDFDKHFLYAFSITLDGKIVTAGGVRTILESVILTDQSFSPRVRREALYQMLQSSIYCADKMSYEELHAFIQDENWLKILQKVGFKPTVGKSLVINW